MKKNIGGIDRTLRIIAGIAFVLVGIFAPMTAWWRVGSFAVAAIAFATAFSSL